jgi:hypothetical protein
MLTELGATEASFRDLAPDCVLGAQDWTACAEGTRSFDHLAAYGAGEAGVNFGRFLGAGKDRLVGMDHDSEITRVAVAGENGRAASTATWPGILILGIDHMPLPLDCVRLGGKRLVLPPFEKCLRTSGFRARVGELGSGFRGVNGKS